MDKPNSWGGIQSGSELARLARGSEAAGTVLYKCGRSRGQYRILRSKAMEYTYFKIFVFLLETYHCISCLSAAAVNVWAKLISLQCNS